MFNVGHSGVEDRYVLLSKVVLDVGEDLFDSLLRDFVGLVQKEVVDCLSTDHRGWENDDGTQEGDDHQQHQNNQDEHFGVALDENFADSTLFGDGVDLEHLALDSL